MLQSDLSWRIQFAFLVVILLILPVYGYACVLPMLGSAGDTHPDTCPFVDCGLSGSHETAQKYCEALKKAETQSFLTLQSALAKTIFGPLLLDYLFLPEMTKVHSTLSPLEETQFSVSQNLYLLHHTLLL